MKDLIDRQAAIEWCLEGLNNMPSTQPEITRCKDCKYYEISELKKDYTDDKRFKPSVCVINAYAVKRPPEWFCADAERRTDEQTLPE